MTDEEKLENLKEWYGFKAEFSTNEEINKALKNYPNDPFKK